MLLKDQLLLVSVDTFHEQLRNQVVIIYDNSNCYVIIYDKSTLGGLL